MSVWSHAACRPPDVFFLLTGPYWALTYIMLELLKDTPRHHNENPILQTNSYIFPKDCATIVWKVVVTNVPARQAVRRRRPVEQIIISSDWDLQLLLLLLLHDGGDKSKIQPQTNQELFCIIIIGILAWMKVSVTLNLFSYQLTSASPLQMDQSAQMSVATSVTAWLWKAINKSAYIEKHCLHFSKISILKS